MDSICTIAECLSNLPSIEVNLPELPDGPYVTVEPLFPNFHSITEGGDLGLQQVGGDQSNALQQVGGNQQLQEVGGNQGLLNNGGDLGLQNGGQEQGLQTGGQDQALQDVEGGQGLQNGEQQNKLQEVGRDQGLQNGDPSLEISGASAT